MKFDIITIFPEILSSYPKETILGRAIKNKIIEINFHDLRKYTNDKHKTVDDSPYGGGVGMVMMVEPIYKALMSLQGAENANKAITKTDTELQQSPSLTCGGTKKTRSILLTPRGKRFTQKDALRLSKFEQIIFVCGRYEGVDERVAKICDEEISIGDFVLSGGELPAMTITEAVTRLLPGVLGKDESSSEESFSDQEKTEYPQYTRPEIFKTKEFGDMETPKILLCGDHAKIAKWRKENRK